MSVTEREAPAATPPAVPARRTVVRTGPIDATPRGGKPGKGGRGGMRGQRSTSLSTTAFVIAGLLVWVFVYLFVLSSFQQGHAQKRLYDQFRSELAEGIAPMASPIPAGDPIAVLSSSALGLDQVVVVEGTTATILQTGPGHLLGSVLPGQAGTTVLLGRSVSFGAPFRNAPALLAGDDISITNQQGTFRYVVTDVRREGDPVPAPVEAGQSRLILVTAAGDGNGPSIAPGATLYVDALLDGEAQPAPPVSAQDPAGAPLKSDNGTATLALLVLALQALVGSIVLVGWARHRWSPLASWVAGVPVLLAALWLASSVAARLIPNLV